MRNTINLAKAMLALSAIVAVTILPVVALAQQPNYRGLVIRLDGQDDFFVDYQYVKPGTSLPNKKFTLQHEYEEENKPATLYLFAADFELASDGVTPIEPENGRYLDNEFSLARFVQFDRTKVTLDKFGDNETVNYAIKLPENIPPGLRYARIIASTADPAIQSADGLTNQSGAGVIGRVTVATLIVSVGNPSQLTTTAEQQEISLRDFDGNYGVFGWLFDLAPIDLVAKIKNTGTNVVLLGGNVTWHDGDPTKPVAFQKFNEDRLRILPGKVRTFKNTWNEGIMYARAKGNSEVEYPWNFDKGFNLAWGRHFVEVRINYKDSTDQTRFILETIEFWVLPWKAILLVIIVIAGYFTYRHYRNRAKSEKAAELVKQARQRKIKS